MVNGIDLTFFEFFFCSRCLRCGHDPCAAALYIVFCIVPCPFLSLLCCRCCAAWFLRCARFSFAFLSFGWLRFWLCLEAQPPPPNQPAPSTHDRTRVGQFKPHADAETRSTQTAHTRIMDPSGASGAAAAGGASSGGGSSSQANNALNALPTPPRPPGLEAWMATHFPITFKQHLAAVDSQCEMRHECITPRQIQTSQRRSAHSAHVSCVCRLFGRAPLLPALCDPVCVCVVVSPCVSFSARFCLVEASASLGTHQKDYEE